MEIALSVSCKKDGEGFPKTKVSIHKVTNC